MVVPLFCLCLTLLSELYFMLNLFSDPCLLKSFTGSQTVAKAQILQYQDLISQ